MMEKYEMITPADAAKISLTDLVKKYNNLIEDLWFYQKRHYEMYDELEKLWADYEEVSNQLYG